MTERRRCRARPARPRGRRGVRRRAGAPPGGARGRARRSRSPRARPGRSAPGRGCARRSPIRTACASSATSTGSSTRGPWRRLAGKCQVFIAPEDDHLRTRLTHAVEVAQVATGIARAANLCLPAHRGDRARARLRPRPGRPRLRGGVLAVPARRLRPRGLRRRRHARAAQPVRRDARRRAQPLVAPARAVARPRARSSRGPTASRTSATTSRTRCGPASSTPADLPAEVARRRRHAAGPQQIGAFVHAVLDADRPHRARSG